MSASIDTYRSVNLGTTSPRQVVIKLYEAAVRYLTEAEDGLKTGQPFQEPLGKARQIVGGLMAALNFEAGELSQRLLQLYLFALDRIQTTGATESDAGLAEVRKVLETLKSGWEAMPAEEARQATPGVGASGLNLRG